MATTWLKGTVKAVPSGDSLLIMGNVKGGPPPEKTITLASLIAPKLARRDGKDESWAWDSREYLRKKCIGKEVTFKVDYVVSSINREFGTVLLDGQNVAYDVVAQGWAKVRPQGGQANEVSATYITELEQRETKAREEELGIWNKTPGAAEAAVRDLPPSAVGDGGNFDAMGFLEANKGKPLPAIVEAVRDGSALRVYLLPEFQYVQVYVAGIQAPSMGRRAPAGEVQPVAEAARLNGEGATAEGEAAAAAVPAPLTTAQKLAASNSAANSAEVPPDPFAKEAKHFAEVRVLNRDVRIVLEGVDKFNNLIGSVRYEDGETAADLALELLKQGLARVVDWSANMLEESTKRVLKATELQAKKDRVRLWTNYVPPVSNSTAIRDDNFSGKVIEIVSGDCVVVADDAAPFGSPLAERRVNLSSIRAPKVGNPKREEKPAAYAREAKEYLRTRLIGQQVNVTMEYSRKVAPTDGPSPAPAVPGADARVMDFGSVFLLAAPKGESLDTVPSSGSAEQPQGINVAEMVVARGFGTVVRHREFEERSNFYDALLAAESRAQKGKKGMHSQKETPAMHINDLSLQGTTAKARQFLPFLQRQRRLPAVVDYVLSGHRFKLIIPKETCAIAFSLSGVRCPGRGEPFADEAIAFMRRKILQRDVEIEVETVDKTGTFLGSLWENRSNVSQALLEAGLAKLHPMFSADRTTEGHLLVQSEQVAKKQQLKVWQGYVEGQAEEAKAAGEVTKSKQEVLKVKVTEVLGGGKFYVQIVGDSRIGAIQNLGVKDKAPLPPGSFIPEKGALVLAQYSADNSWNRAMVVNAPKPGTASGKSEFEIFYVDYGNQETVPLSRLRPLEGAIGSTAGVAQLCKLAYIKVPDLEEEFGIEAAEYLSNTIGDKVLTARVVEKDTSGGKVKGQGTGPCLIVMMEDAETHASINTNIVEAGLGRVEKKLRWDPIDKKTALDSLAEHQEIARKSRLNIWQYGDVESDEEDVPSRGRGGGGRGR
ncbi:staphylococcal nuclease domain-containing protein 1 [Marchantia polymorpha subsp. ruderalis]|uniref:Ribonuclease n=2 Tax=Marchantia polymorpha TaxID=3197 RepID=A0A176W327_MARPO|nr:hypothetical protein AXG93_1027s1120 [Marchantia polymorpha subsp. ruderalis]PTQ42108.1 hypothetical protein MARPO_0031s0082 [Marchantia polymorpha]BBN01059.1 hypothetical protein Mp_2g04260 [Marchantia polymorpha subsp. ruderalis]|eukprot:PTQ42108.1 hypothetical protein MARPO_0031s0082 [Marchantia polymorpha]